MIAKPAITEVKPIKAMTVTNNHPRPHNVSPDRNSGDCIMIRSLVFHARSNSSNSTPFFIVSSLLKMSQRSQSRGLEIRLYYAKA